MMIPLAGILETIGEWLQGPREWTVQVLNKIFGPLNEFLATLDPETTGRYCAVGLFGIALLWAVSLRSEFIFRGAPTKSRWRDLRLWAVVALTPYILIYLFLF
jgi:hypothetical protein